MLTGQVKCKDAGSSVVLLHERGWPSKFSMTKFV